MPASAYATFYDPAYYKSSDSLRRGYEDYAAERDSILRTFERRWQRLARHAVRPLAGGRYLDVGCAYGYALEVARAAGMEPFGVDVSAHAASEARSRGLAVVEGGIEQAVGAFAAGGPMRVVTSWDVIEHLPDPRRHLQIIAELLEPGGLISVITPDRASAGARLLGPRWVEYRKPEEHIYFFRRQDLRALLEDAGFEVIDQTTAGKEVAIGFALGRLEAYHRVFGWVARLAGPVARRTLYVDPLDKMHLVGRVRRRG
jgi:2-polyprenyl-3-methyl-5-hydroxy-6-metoxy-1,4-benzoquinol methylase